MLSFMVTGSKAELRRSARAILRDPISRAALLREALGSGLG